MLVFPEARSDTVACSKCGAITVLKADHLSRRCSGQFTSRTIQINYNKMIETGRHPVTGERVGVGRPIAEEVLRCEALDESFVDDDAWPGEQH